MNFRIALTAAATLALAACGSTEDASTEAEADTVEIAADDALADVEAEPVEDLSLHAHARASHEERVVARRARSANRPSSSSRTIGRTNELPSGVPMKKPRSSE